MKKCDKARSAFRYPLKFDLKMKLSLFLFSVVLLNTQAATYSQQKKISLTLKEVSVEQVLSKIESLSEYNFLYNDNEIKFERMVSIDVKRERISTILQKLFIGTNVIYDVIGKQIVLKASASKSIERLKTLTKKKSIYVIEISGQVTDENGLPLPGASIIVKGTTTGTTTDQEGKFALKIPDDTAILVVSYVGFEAKEIAIDGRTVIDVKLTAMPSNLNEIVVIGYGKVKRSDLTGAISSVTAEEFKKGVIFSTEQLLQGKVAGLSVIQSSGDPTSTASMRLRGGTSLSAGNGPLVVVDGISGVDFNTIQPSEIISIDVLKDASACAIYGSRGANGVIIVTTNSSRKGKSMKYDGYYAIGKIPKNVDLLSAGQWREYVKKNNPAGAVDYGGDTDWQKAIQQTSVIHSHTISFVNNGEEGGNRISLNYLSNTGAILTSSLKRLGAGLSGHQFTFRKKLRLEAGIHSAFDKSKQIDYRVFNRAYNLNPTIPIRDANGNYTNIVGVFYENPVEISNDRTSDNSQQRIFGYLKAELELLKGLKWVTTGSYEYNSTQNRLYIPTYAVLDGQTEKGRAERSFSNYSNQQLETYFTCDLEFKGNHRLNLLAGYSYLDHIYEGFGAQRRSFDSNSFLYNNLGAGRDIRATDVSSFKGQSALISFYGRANYSYLNKYLVTASIRRDGSSRFGENNKWGVFPSASVAWKVSEESFMQNASGWLDNLKLRIGYGITGNQEGIGEYKSLSLIGAGGAPYYDAETRTWKQSYGIVQNHNPDLKWESTAQFNVGVDFLLFKIFNCSLEFYNKKTSDLLYTYEVPQPPYLYGTILANVGDLSNKGVELTLTTNLLEKTDLNWNATLTLSHNIQKIEKLSNQTYQTDAIYTGSLHGLPGMSGQYAQVVKEGYAVGTFWGPKSTGIDANGQITYANNGAAQDLGNAQPKLNYGLSTDLAYKKFDFQVALYGMSGQKVLNATNMVYSDPNRLPVNNATNSSLTSGIKSNAAYSSQWVEEASFLRLQNLTIGYNLDIKKMGIEKSRISLTAENLFVLTGYSGIDPEINIDGLDHPGMDVYNYYPKTRTISLGLNLSF